MVKGHLSPRRAGPYGRHTVSSTLATDIMIDASAYLQRQTAKRAFLGCTRPRKAEREFLGLVGGHLPHLLAAASQITVTAFENADDTSALRTFVDIGFPCHNRPPYV